MFHAFRLFTIVLLSHFLIGCGSTEPPNFYATYGSYQPYFHGQQSEVPTSVYRDYASPRDRLVSESNYDAVQTRVSHKDIDRNWVNEQNPNHFTIQVDESEKAAQVASKLQKAPKGDRMAEIKAYREGKTFYKGVYGSYNNYDEAQKALNNLPDDIKQGASVKHWGSIQENVSY